MRDLREHLVELSEAGSRQARVPGAPAAIHRGRRRRRQLAAGAALMAMALIGGFLVGRWITGWGGGEPDMGGSPRPPATTLQPFPVERFLMAGPGEVRQLDGPVRLMAEGSAKGRHWAFYLYSLRHTAGAGPGQVQFCQGLVDWEPNGRVGGWHSVCHSEQELRIDRRLTLGLDEPVENELFVYQGLVTKQAARIRFQLTGQQPFETQRIIDLGSQAPNNWYLAFFSPKGGTKTMLNPRVLTRATVFDAAGRTICAETFGRNPPPAERDGCR
jgi:hypothetical protein